MKPESGGREHRKSKEIEHVSEEVEGVGARAWRRDTHSSAGVSRLFGILDAGYGSTTRSPEGRKSVVAAARPWKGSELLFERYSCRS